MKILSHGREYHLQCDWHGGEPIMTGVAKVCVGGGNPQGQKHNIFAPRIGRGERGGYDHLKRRLISWVNPRFFFAGTALDSKSEK